MADVFLDPIVPVVTPVAGPLAAYGPINVMKYVGEGYVPSDVKRRRTYNLETMRRLGTPVLIKHMLNDQDARLGVAKKSPGMDSTYGQPRHDDPLSFGAGYVSVQDSPDEWYHMGTGAIVRSSASPGTDFVRAPLYRGFGVGYLTYIIEPDIAEDFFKLTETGALIQTQTATAQAPWFPEVSDNDLIINVELDRAGNIVAAYERYQAKMSSPISIRGHQRRGLKEDRGGKASQIGDGGNRFAVGSQFEMTLIPQLDVLYKVEIDR